MNPKGTPKNLKPFQPGESGNPGSSRRNLSLVDLHSEESTLASSQGALPAPGRRSGESDAHSHARYPEASKPRGPSSSCRAFIIPDEESLTAFLGIQEISSEASRPARLESSTTRSRGAVMVFSVSSKA